MNRPDYSKVPYPSISKLFKQAGIESPAQLIPVCYNGQPDEYIKHRITYTVKAPLEKVWDQYISTHPSITWNTEMIRFAFVYSRNEDRYIYNGQETFPGLQKGQIFLVNLNIVKGLRIAVAHEVAEVNEEEKVVKLCYLNTGKTAGSQWIKMREIGQDETEIEHKTLYKGTSFIRDRLLYPYFHAKAMRQFHHKVRDLIMD